jgi:flagellum-specific peptidoglycan hydrolase FlgJ
MFKYKSIFKSQNFFSMELQPYRKTKSVRDLELHEWFLIQIKFFKSVNMHTKVGIVLFFATGTATIGCAVTALTSDNPSPRLVYAYAVAKPIPEAVQAPEKMVYKPVKKKAANPQAPAMPPQYDAPAYIAKFARIAQREAKNTGIPASITLAQGLIESRAGTSSLAVKNNNHFGLKCFSKACKRGHCSNYTDDTHKDFFLKFTSAEESYKRHSAFLKAKRYKRLFWSKDYRSWASGLQKCGYATAPDYAATIVRVIETYDLHKYD